MAAYATASAPLPLPGCYVFVRDSDVLYVGESKNVKRRLVGHDWRRLLHDGATIRAFACANHKQVEKWLIEELSPMLNGRSRRNRDATLAAAARIAAIGKPVEQRFAELANELFGGFLGVA